MSDSLTGDVQASPENEHQSKLLEIKDLKKWFPIQRGFFSRTVGHVRAVDGVSLYVRKGETLGLVGESGCGKTTLGRVLLGLEKVDGGEIHFDGIAVHDLTGRRMNALRKRIQVIFQDPQSALNPRMTVLDIVTEGLARFNMLSGDRREHAGRLMQEVGLSEDAVFRFPHEFSGGQRQRDLYRPGHFSAPGFYCLRRGGQRSGCLHPGPDHQSVDGSAEPLPPVLSVYIPRSERGGQYRRSGGGHVSGPDHGIRPDGGYHPRTPASLYPGADFGRSRSRPRPIRADYPAR
jgi:ABC-type lipoprotein export system ATPase subunit